MVLDKKDWDVICEILEEFKQKLESKFEAYSEIFSEEPYPTEIQQNAVWLKDACEYARKLLKLQTDFIEMLKKGPTRTS